MSEWFVCVIISALNDCKYSDHHPCVFLKPNQPDRSPWANANTSYASREKATISVATHQMTLRCQMVRPVKVREKIASLMDICLKCYVVAGTGHVLLDM